MSICVLRMKLQASQGTQVHLQNARCYSRLINKAQTRVSCDDRHHLFRMRRVQTPLDPRFRRS